MATPRTTRLRTIALCAAIPLLAAPLLTSCALPTDKANPSASASSTTNKSGINILDGAAIIGATTIASTVPWGVQASDQKQKDFVTQLALAKKNDPKNPAKIDLGVAGNKLVDYQYSPGEGVGCFIVTNTSAANGLKPTQPNWLIWVDNSSQTASENYHFIASDIHSCDDARAKATQVKTAEQKANLNVAFLGLLGDAFNVVPFSNFSSGALLVFDKWRAEINAQNNPSPTSSATSNPGSSPTGSQTGTSTPAPSNS